MRKELYLGFHTNLQGSTHQRWCELGHIPNACRSFRSQLHTSAIHSSRSRERHFMESRKDG